MAPRPARQAGTIVAGNVFRQRFIHSTAPAVVFRKAVAVSFLPDGHGIARGAPMQSLTLAVEIADIVSAAKRRRIPFDVEAKAERLLKDHPEAEASRSEIADTLRDESVALGLILA